MTTIEFTMQNRPKCAGLHACAEAALEILKSGNDATMSVAVGEWKATIRISARETRYGDQRDVKHEARIEDSSGYAAAAYFLKRGETLPQSDQVDMMLLVMRVVRGFASTRQEMFRVACVALDEEELR